MREPLPFLEMDKIVIERENVTKIFDLLIDENLLWETAHKRCQYKDFKKHWCPLQI